MLFLYGRNCALRWIIVANIYTSILTVSVLQDLEKHYILIFCASVATLCFVRICPMTSLLTTTAFWQCRNYLKGLCVTLFLILSLSFAISSNITLILFLMHLVSFSSNLAEL